MARKKHAKTPEQRLEGALMPREEQPYAVPDNWCWVRLGACINKSTDKQTVCTSDDCYIGLENMESGKGVISYGDASALKSEKAVFHPGQVLYGRLRPYLDKHDVAEVEGVCSTDILVYDVNPCSDARYIDYLMSTRRFVRHASSCAKGVNLPRVSPADVERFPIPLPPLAEQKRIVERVEGLFVKLDKAEFELQQAIEGSVGLRDSILYDAFNTASEEDWNIVAVSQIVDSLKYGTSEKSSYEYEGMAVLRIPNIGDEGIDFADMKHLSHRDVKKDDLLHENDILMIRSNGSRDLVGRCGIVPRLADKYTYASFLIRIRPSDDVYPAYLWRFLQSPQAREQLFNRAKSSSGIHNINSKEIGQIRMPLPPLDTQKTIVKRLGASLAREGAVVQIMRETLKCIQNIRAEVLAKALQGKLGTNNEGDSHAREELLSMFEAIING